MEVGGNGTRLRTKKRTGKKLLLLVLFLKETIRHLKAGTSNKEKGQEHEKQTRIFSFPDKQILKPTSTHALTKATRD